MNVQGSQWASLSANMAEQGRALSLRIAEQLPNLVASVQTRLGRPVLAPAAKHAAGTMPCASTAAVPISPRAARSPRTAGQKRENRENGKRRARRAGNSRLFVCFVCCVFFSQASVPRHMRNDSAAISGGTGSLAYLADCAIAHCGPSSRKPRFSTRILG